LKLENSVVIGCPIDEVFDLVGNPDNDPEWGSLIIKSEQVSPGPVSVGSTFQQTASFMGGRFTTMIEVTDYEPGRLLRYRATEPLTLQHSRVFEEAQDGTRLTFVIEIEPKGKYLMTGSIVKPIADQQVKEDLDEIKVLLEAPKPAGS
jgi:uncharacterized membrane protein